MTYFAELTARLGKALGMKGAPAAEATAPTRTVEPGAEPPVASQASATPAAGAE
jgi:hypothetical protein